MPKPAFQPIGLIIMSVHNKETIFNVLANANSPEKIYLHREGQTNNPKQINLGKFLKTNKKIIIETDIKGNN